PISVLYVSGRRKASLPAGKILFFRPDHDVTVLWPQGDAHDLLFSKSKTPDLGAYYDHCDIESAVHWKTAVMLSRQWRTWSRKIPCSWWAIIISAGLKTATS